MFASSGEVYPENVPDYLPVDEDHPAEAALALRPDQAPRRGTRALRERTSGVAATILRFSHTQDADELLDPASFFSGPRFFLHPKIRQQESFGHARRGRGR